MGVADLAARGAEEARRLPLGQREQQRRQALRQGLEGGVGEAPFRLQQAPPQRLSDPQRDPRVAQQYCLDVLAAHQAEDAGSQGLRVAVVQRLTEDRHLAEDRPGREDRDGEGLALRREAVEAHPPDLEDEEHLARLLQRVEDGAGRHRLHRRALAQRLDIRRREIPEDVDLGQVALLRQVSGRCRPHRAPPRAPATPARRGCPGRSPARARCRSACR